MKKTCVLIIHQSLLWRRALEEAGIIHSGQALKVVNGEATSVQGLIDEILLYGADVVLMSESSTVAQRENLAELLMVYPRLLVIMASDESNWVHIFRKEDILLKHINDLFDVITSTY